MKKIAIIELGSLTVKLKTAVAQDNETFKITNEIVDNIKIANDLYDDWLIKPARIQELLAILKNYKLFCEANEIEQIECLASCEYLDAKNHSSFIEELYSQCGFKFKIMEKDEQILYAYTGVINTMDAPKGLLVSIDGNRTQILHYNRRSLLNQFTFDFGACNLAEACSSKELSPEAYCDAMYQKFEKELSECAWLKELDEETQLVGVGDTFSSIGKLSRKLKKYPYEKEHNYQLSKEDFGQVYDFVKGLDIDKTKKIKGISSARADILASGICIVKAILSKTICKNIAVCSYGIGEGLLFNIASPITLEKPITDTLGYSLSRENAFYNNYSPNTEVVYSLAMMLYKQLKVLHKLPRNYVKVLRIAAIFHDAGKRINTINYEKYGYEVVLNSNLFGVNHKEQILAAFVVACQYSDNFNMLEFVKYREILTEEDMIAVKQLGVIVRMANALDIFNKNKIQDISCDILGDSVILKTIVETSCEMEIREALRCELDFYRAFRKHLEIL